MTLGLRLSLLPLLIAACASQPMVVPDSDWHTVPPTQRATMDREYASEMAAARAELASASASLAELQHAPAPAAARPVVPAAAPDLDDPAMIAELQRHNQAAAAAHARVDAAQRARQRADLTWRQARFTAAGLRIEMLVQGRELRRAQAVDHSLPGTDHYEDVAPLRGQFSRAQRRWYTASTAARQTRGAFEHASAVLAAAKERYAQVMRGGPLEASAQPAADDDAPPIRLQLQLQGWAVTRSDIRRRRGLRHYLDEVAAAPAQLRKTPVRLRVRSLPVARPAPDAAEAAAKPGDPAAAAVAAKPAATKPAATAAKTTDAAVPAAMVATKPASATGKPADAPAPAVATTKPALAKPGGLATAKSASPAAAVATTKPAASTPAAVKPATRTEPPIPAVPVSAKPVEP